MTAQPDLAVHDEWPTGGDLALPGAQFADGEVQRAGDGAARVLGGGAYVDQDGAVGERGVQLVPLHGAGGAGGRVLGDRPGHVHRVLGRAVGRGVGEFRVGQVRGSCRTP